MIKNLIIKFVALSALALILSELGDYFVWGKAANISLGEVGIALLLGFVITAAQWTFLRLEETKPE